ncbi:MAG: hypothetical protein ACRCTL_18195 [Pseudomonas sp.]
MQNLTKLFESHYSAAQIDLTDPGWYMNCGIPSEAGWYFITTNTPIEVLARQELWASTYITKKAKASAKVKNYNLKIRAIRFSSKQPQVWSKVAVYSGKTSDLRARAKEHTFPDPGTAGLAIAKYPELQKYEWVFNYHLRSRLNEPLVPPDVTLLLGEQIWRATNGWPVLCAG